MERAVIERTIIDALIRAKLATLSPGERVEAMPVAWQPPNVNGCNWFIPGWIGDARGIVRCSEHLAHYLAFLQSQFDIPEEGRREHRQPGV
jgi:hypothetical protein